MQNSSVLIASSLLLTLTACTPYTGPGSRSGTTGDTLGPSVMFDKQPTRTDCFWRFQIRPQQGSDGQKDMIFAINASKHVARIQLDGTLYKLNIKSSVFANPLVYRAKGLAVEVTRKTSTEEGRMDAVLAITTQAGLSKVMPVTGKEECQ